MKERFLHYLWQYQLFSTNLQTTLGEKLSVVKVGRYNTNAGPDFLNAQLIINEQKWIGNIEIHIKTSDWYAHNHENDTAFDAIILHVVWENDTDVFMKNNQPLPTVEIKNFVDSKVLNNYQRLFTKQLQWIPCEKQIAKVPSFIFSNWLERLYFERLQTKTSLVQELLLKTKNNYEAVLFCMLAKGFGLKVNGEAFLSIATSFDFSILRKVANSEKQLSALIFGQAGLLEETIEEEYFMLLKNEYRFLQHKFGLKPIHKSQLQFFRMRPANFPTIRLAQLTALYFKQINLFSELMKIKNLADFYTIFNITIFDFWKTHYTFPTTSKKSAKKLTKSFIHLLLINVVIPLRFVYKKQQDILNQEEILALIQQLPSEKNNIISKFSSIGVCAKNAFETQALLQLKNTYCNAKRCLDCVIGNHILSE